MRLSPRLIPWSRPASIRQRGPALTQAELFEAALAEIRAGIKMARAKGVVIGPILYLDVRKPN